MPEDNIEIELLGAFAKEGVDGEGLLALRSASVAEGKYVLTTQAGAELRLTRGELDERWERCLGAFKEEVGTLVGQISYATSAIRGRSQTVSFHAPAYLANANRLGIPRPPSFSYDIALDVQGSAYQRRVQISQEIKPGDTARFTIKTAVARSSQHRLRATVRDVTGMELDTLPIVIDCFILRSSNRFIDHAMSKRTKGFIRHAGAAQVGRAGARAVWDRSVGPRQLACAQTAARAHPVN